MAQVYCPRCEALAIQGVPCHERGCPNANEKWEFRGRRNTEYRHCIPANEETPDFLKPTPKNKKK